MVLITSGICDLFLVTILYLIICEFLFRLNRTFILAGRCDVIRRRRATLLERKVCVFNPLKCINQWCSLRDTQVYGVYTLGKVKDLRSHLKKHADT